VTKLLRPIVLVALVLALAACASVPESKPLVAATRIVQSSADDAGNEHYIGLLYESRTWVPARKLAVDTSELARRAQTPVQYAEAKFIGPRDEDALRSLALKIWMIENAEHTLDAVYYIYKNDLVGKAILGALCEAVQRGVDVRLMVDAVGSYSLTHNNLRKLQDCAQQAGYMRTADGTLTPYRARVQTVVINALTRRLIWANRRSHDKFLLMDATFPGRNLVMTGGRNISLDYYGIQENGQADADTYRDAEIILRSGSEAKWGDISPGDISEAYYDLLFLHKGNSKLLPMRAPPPSVGDASAEDRDLSYPDAQRALAQLKSFPMINAMLADMPDYLAEGFHRSPVRLAHEIGNLSSRNPVQQTQENLAENQNSIMRTIDQMGYENPGSGVLRIVSPYLFLARYYDKQGNLVQDDVQAMFDWLQQNPGSRVEIVTNSVLTSDNFMAQSIIDLEMAPSLLLSPEMQVAWHKASEEPDRSLELVQSVDWKRSIEQSRIRIYQTGRLDSVLFDGGDVEYGKLHAKFISGDPVGFIGTANFDYRSRLFNNEMGFFYDDKALNNEAIDMFEYLKARAYRWGSPEWLEMRRKVMKSGGMKAWSTRHQRGIFNFLKASGIHWLI